MLLLMFLPGLLYFIIFHYLPMYGTVLAFKDFRISEGIWGSPWVGFRHFEYAFDDLGFINALRNTLIISLLKLVLGFPAPIIFAILLNEIGRSTFKKFVQTVSYLPHFISWVVLGGVFISFLSLNGPLNLILEMFGFAPRIFMSEENGFVAILILTDIWKGFGWGAIIYIAALAGLDPSMYEAAVIDGANRWHRIRYITLPSLVPVMTILIILSMSGILDAGFDQIFNMYNSRVVDVSEIIDTYVYKKGLVDADYSYATAIGLFKSIVALVMIVISNKIANTIRGKEADALW